MNKKPVVRTSSLILDRVKRIFIVTKSEIETYEGRYCLPNKQLEFGERVQQSQLQLATELIGDEVTPYRLELEGFSPHNFLTEIEIFGKLDSSTEIHLHNIFEAKEGFENKLNPSGSLLEVLSLDKENNFDGAFDYYGTVLTPDNSIPGLLEVLKHYETLVKTS